MMNICKIWMKSVKKWHDYKTFYLRGRNREDANYSYLAMFKALLLPNYISEQPRCFRDASNFAKYCKNNIICIVTFKGQRSWPSNLTVFSSCYKFSKIFIPRHGFISWFGRIFADKISIDLRKFYCKISNVCEIFWVKLGTKWKN